MRLSDRKSFLVRINGPSLVVVKQVYETGKNKEIVTVAGLHVSSGKLSRTHYFRVMRDEEVLADRVKAASMRIHKDRVNEVTKDKVSRGILRHGTSRL